MTLVQHLPKDWREALLVGRLDAGAGPVPIVVANGRVRDVSRHAPTVSELLNMWSGAVPPGEDLGPLDQLPINAWRRPWARRGTTTEDGGATSAC